MFGAAVLGLACAVLGVGEARAGVLTMTISDGTTSYDIFDQIPPDINLNPNQIQADTTGLIFADFNIIGLNASSNNPGANNPIGGILAVGGHIQRTTGGGPVTLTITTYQTGYVLPAGAPRNMISTSSSSFSNVPGGSTQTFESWYNPSSPATPPAPFGTPAPLITFPLAGTDSVSDTTSIGGLPDSPEYSLTNRIVLTIGGVTDGSTPDVVFGGQTQILAVVVPEPTSVIMLGMAAPLGLLLAIRSRRRFLRRLA